ncbi:MAG TPA: cation:proton antiporter [Gaiellaceae bacterium]|jgi:NhaP-type Na+/H+ or K+/H+ antiporter|nr:cation:proton antiporter [Gaiellaceae bacterium]
MSALSTDDILLGLGLVVVLAIGSQLLARRLAIPAIVVLLPVGFIAGIATEDVQPDKLLAALYQPFVSLAVGVILFEAGLRLSFREVAVGVHKVLLRLLAAGVLVTWIGVAATVALLFDDMDRGVAWLIGAILVVSGPTVVLPLLAFIRPTRNVRSLLKWEGTLVDPIGALLGVVVFHAVRSEWQPGDFLLAIGAGAFVGVAGAVVLQLLLRDLHLNAPRQAVPATLMVVVGSLVVADLLRDDAGFVATVIMGVALANQRRIDVSLTLEFQETLVQLLVGVLFVLIAASVSPGDVEAVLPEAIVLVVLMVVVLRPLAVALATARSAFTLRERAFVAWMAPRGIVAGATASAFGLQLAEKGVAGADAVLPVVFVVIFGTVLLYGLTAPLAARLLGVAGAGSGLVLVVGGHQWAREIAHALKQAGVDVRMWVGAPADREAARAAGIDADRGRMMVDSVGREAELEDITDVLLLTRSDDFNAVAAAELRGELGHGHVFRVAPDPEEPDLLPPATEGGILGGQALTFAELSGRFAHGARLVARPEHEQLDATDVPLFAVSSDGRLSVAADGRSPAALPGGTVIALLSG